MQTKSPGYSENGGKTNRIEVDAEDFTKVSALQAQRAAEELGLDINPSMMESATLLARYFMQHGLQHYCVTKLVEEVEFIQKCRRISGAYFLGEMDPNSPQLPRVPASGGGMDEEPLTNDQKLAALEWACKAAITVRGLTDGLMAVQDAIAENKPLKKKVKAALLIINPVANHLKQIRGASDGTLQVAEN